MVEINNYKKGLIVISIFMILVFAIGSIAASENVTGDVELDNFDGDNISEGDFDNTELDNNLESDTSSNYDNSTSDSIIQTNNSKEDLITYDDAYQKSTIEYNSAISYKNSGNIVYNVKAYSVYKFNGITYKDPKLDSIVKVKLYTGKASKIYSARVDNKGIASIKMPKLAIGKYKVEIFLDNVKRVSSYIKVVKSTAKVYAPVKSIKHKKNTYYKIKVLDSYGNYVKKVTLKVKVYTGKKAKTYSVKTNNKGIAKLKTKNLALGTHKILIKSNSKKFKISKNDCKTESVSPCKNTKERHIIHFHYPGQL